MFNTEIYLSVITGLGILAFLILPFRKRKILEKINPLCFTLTLIKMLFLSSVQVVFIFLPVLAGIILEQTLYPWLASPTLYTAMGIGCGLVGLFFIIQLAKMLRIQPTGTELRIWALVVLFVYTVAAVTMFGTEISYFFAAPLLLYSLSFSVRGSFWLIVIGLVGVFPLLSTVGPSHISMIITLSGVTVPAFTLMLTVYVLSLPYIFYFAGAVQVPDRHENGAGRIISSKVTAHECEYIQR